MLTKQTDLNEHVKNTEGNIDYKKVNSNEFISKKDKNIKDSDQQEYDPYKHDSASEKDSTKNNPKSLPNSENSRSLPTSSTMGSLNEQEKKAKVENISKDLAEYQRESVAGSSSTESPSHEYDPYRDGVYKRSTIDFVLEKQKTEMPSIYESDGED